MSKLGPGITSPDGRTLYTVDMRDEIITSVDQFMEAIDRFRRDHIEQIGVIIISVTQEHCLKADRAIPLYANLQRLRLDQCMGYAVRVSTEYVSFLGDSF